MDVRKVLTAVLPPQLRPKERVEKSIKADSTTDRDANGQASYGGGEKQREPMTEEQLKKALEHIKALPVVKEHNLSVELIQSEGRNTVLIKEPSGKVIRRIPEHELWSLQVVKENEKGQLLRKTA